MPIQFLISRRFWNKVNKDSGVVMPGMASECWIWTAGRTSAGYGGYWVDGQTAGAHRYLYEVMHGPLVEGMMVCHKCNNPICVRPNHLYAGTCQDNVNDRSAAGTTAVGDRHPTKIHGSGYLPRGEEHKRAKLTEEDVLSIRTAYDEDAVSQNQLARDYKVAVNAIHSIVHRRTWRHVGEVA